MNTLSSMYYPLKDFISDISNLVLPVLTALGGWYVSRRKAKADAAASELENVQKAIQIWRELAQDMEKKSEQLIQELEDMKKQNKALMRDMALLRGENRNLKAQIQSLEKKLSQQ
jgi:septal ring factor EnvC (AmiA/AmiB activator)